MLREQTCGDTGQLTVSVTTWKQNWHLRRSWWWLDPFMAVSFQCVWVCVCYSPWSGGSRARLVIVSYYSPRKSSELIETDLWVRLRPLTHQTPPLSQGGQQPWPGSEKSLAIWAWFKPPPCQVEGECRDPVFKVKAITCSGWKRFRVDSPRVMSLLFPFAPSHLT